MPKIAKEQFCFNCGDSLGFYADADPLDTCGKQECEREARNTQAAEREEAHQRLDDERGWGRW